MEAWKNHALAAVDKTAAELFFAVKCIATSLRQNGILALDRIDLERIYAKTLPYQPIWKKGLNGFRKRKVDALL